MLFATNQPSESDETGNATAIALAVVVPVVVIAAAVTCGVWRWQRNKREIYHSKRAAELITKHQSSAIPQPQPQQDTDSSKPKWVAASKESLKI